MTEVLPLSGGPVIVAFGKIEALTIRISVPCGLKIINFLHIMLNKNYDHLHQKKEKTIALKNRGKQIS
jgi:hypothetical protein